MTLTSGFTPIAPLYRVEHAFARLGRWRRLSRGYEGSAASARAGLEVAGCGIANSSALTCNCSSRTGLYATVDGGSTWTQLWPK